MRQEVSCSPNAKAFRRREALPNRARRVRVKVTRLPGSATS